MFYLRKESVDVLSPARVRDREHGAPHGSLVRRHALGPRLHRAQELLQRHAPVLVHVQLVAQQALLLAVQRRTQ